MPKKNGKRPPAPSENGGKDSGKEPELVPQAHGGALLSGGKPGNPGNRRAVGRPPNAIRASLRMDFDTRRHYLNEIIDGVVPLRERCPECGYEPEPDAAKATRASTRDRLSALEVVARYSDIRDGSALSNELLNELGAAVLEAVRDAIPEKLYEKIRDGLIDVIEDRWVKIVAHDVLGRSSS